MDYQDILGTTAERMSAGNSGIGYETAQQLALHNARVYIAGRSRDRVEKAIQQMKKTCAGRILDLRFLELDLKDLRSVKASTATFAQWEPRLDILINNAGVCLPTTTMARREG